MYDSFVPEVQTIEQVEVNVEDVDVGNEDKGREKVENPPINIANPSVLEKNVEKEKMKVKVKVKTGEKHTMETMEGKKVIDDPEFIQGPIDLTSLSPIQKLKLASFAQEKASEDLLKSHTKDNMLLTLTICILEKLVSSLISKGYLRHSI